MSNRLVRETSPYLLQHAGNPVDWFPWGDEAFKIAKDNDKPVLLSIGYSACHWCHVMAHESFENEEIARLMNDNFVNIKVDREERPDVDHVYMEAVQAMVGGGGWPLTVFLTPEGKPFYGGTYFPPEDRQGIPGFSRVLKSASEAYHNKRSSIEATTSQITDFLNHLTKTPKSPVSLDRRLLSAAEVSLEQCFDNRNGGFGGAPKFPNPLTLEFLLRYYNLSGEERAMEMVDLTLEKMAAGGIYDQIGGGFHRYSTDNKWQIPHFEKMLYDNALLCRLYLHAYMVAGKDLFAEIARETIDFVLREMTSPEGGFFSSLDADTESEEGAYYVWAKREIEEALTGYRLPAIDKYYGITEQGNFEGRNILHRTSDTDEPAELSEVKKVLLKHREARTYPGRDEKILASWNGMMLVSISEASAVFGSQDYLNAAVNNGLFLKHMISDSELMHSSKDGTIKINGFLEDYANVIDGFLSLHQATLDSQWLESAIELTEMMVKNCYDMNSEKLFDTSSRQCSNLFVRPRNDFDGAVPSGAASATLVLQKLGILTGNSKYKDIAKKSLESVSSNIAQTPLGYSQWLCALDFYLSPQTEVVLAGFKNDDLTRSLAGVINRQWLPNAVFAIIDPTGSSSLKGLPLFKGRQMVKGQAAAYFCHNYTCQTPVVDPGELEELIS